MDKKVIHSVIDHQVAVHAEQTAIEHGSSCITYGELKRFSNRIAGALEAGGVEVGDTVGLFFNSSIGYVASLLGVGKAGGVFMPIEPDYPIRQQEDLLRLTGLRYMICQPGHASAVQALFAGAGLLTEPLTVLQVSHHDEPVHQITCRDGVWQLLPEQAYSPEDIPLKVNGNDSNYLIYTSGSTGQPKIIEGCHKGLSHFVHWEVGEFGLGSDTRVSQLAPLTFDVSFRDILVPLLAGGTLCIPEPEVRKQPHRLLQWLLDARVNVVHIVPSVFRLLMKELSIADGLREQVRQMRHILLAGEALFNRDVLQWRQLVGEAVELVNVYGPSETTLAKIFHRIGPVSGSPHEIVDLGKPISNTNVLILKNNRLCNVGEVGEICIKTPFRSKGYYRNPELTSERFVRNPLNQENEDIIYRSGDLGKYRPDGNIVFAGRQDNQLKIRGNRVELGAIEKVIGEYAGIDQVVVVPVAQFDGEPALTCYYVPEKEIDQSALRAHIRAFLPGYMQPAYYIALDAFPLNFNGKVDRKKLPKPEEMVYAQLEYVPPRTELEAQLAGIWHEVLGLQKIGVLNSFFELGGHSLSATQVVSRINRAFGRNISLKAFFDTPSIAGLAQVIAQSATCEVGEISPVSSPDGHYPLSAAQAQMWADVQMNPGSTAYNVFHAYQLLGDLRVECLERAFGALMERHESLRTTFVAPGGIPVQKIRAPAALPPVFAYRDIRHEADPDASAKAYLEREEKTGFELTTGPLLRVKLFRVAGQRYVFAFNMHHIISDAWSLIVLGNEIATLYEDFCREQPVSLLPLTFHYKDFAGWHNARLTDGYLAPHREYWKKELAGPLPASCLPVDFAAERIPDFTGSNMRFQVDADTSRQLEELCRKHSVTLYAAFNAALAIVLHKYSGQTDLLIGTSVAGRTHKGAESQIGLYINMLPLRVRIRPADSFGILLGQIRDKLVAILESQDYPYSTLVRELRQRQPLPMDALFKVATTSFMDINIRHISSLGEGRNRIEVHNLPYEITSATKYDLTFQLTRADQISVNMIYNAGLFKEQTMVLFRERLQALLKEVVSNDDVPVDQLKCAAAAEALPLEDRLVARFDF